MPCKVCAAPLFTWEHPVGLCRTHGLIGTDAHEGQVALCHDGRAFVEPNYRRDRLNALRDLGSLVPPIPERGMSVRWVREVLQPTEEELRAFVEWRQQPLTPAMRGAFDRGDVTITLPAIDPVTRQANGERRAMRLV